MRRIERTARFKRDYKRESKGAYRATLQDDLRLVLLSLVCDEVLPDRYRDHALTGNWVDHRDCHIKPDLILIYRKPDTETLQLVRIGSHAELGLCRPFQMIDRQIQSQLENRVPFLEK